MKINKVPYDGGTMFYFACPGCHQIHGFNHTWEFNGDLDSPTVSPSILVFRGSNESYRCHSFIRSGRIEFLADCSHALAGQTVDLPEYHF